MSLFESMDMIRRAFCFHQQPRSLDIVLVVRCCRELVVRRELWPLTELRPFGKRSYVVPRFYEEV